MFLNTDLRHQDWDLAFPFMFCLCLMLYYECSSSLLIELFIA